MKNIGHGHVFDRLDGYMARCGGPKVCKACMRDMAELKDLLAAKLAELDTKGNAENVLRPLR